MELSKVKLMIWDLDETLWKGTLSEENVEVNKPFIDFINDTLDAGIVHSICSKNDYHKTKNKLQKLGIWDLFMFPSIDWTPKGQRVKSIIEHMKLRPENVLFIDDNVQNLQEAAFYCGGGLMIAAPDDISLFVERGNEIVKSDPSRKRLKQYKILQEKEDEKSKFSSNDDFLKSCNIRVEICTNCLDEIDRIHELIMRSNQLNYTKFRQEKHDLEELLKKEDVTSGYVKVHDKFGDYGIVGFFAVKNNKAIHYLFSCRTLGMLIEQYIYTKIGNPEIDIVGEVVTHLEKDYIPEWINQQSISDPELQTNDARRKITAKVLMKGPCDLEQMFSFIQHNENIITEFTYVGKGGITVEGHNHSGQALTAVCTEEKRKNEIIKEVPFFDDNMLSTRMSDRDIDVVVYSLLSDGNLGLYRRKGTGEQIALCEKLYDLTNPVNWELYIGKRIFTSNINFTIENLKRFSELYEYVPNNGSITVENLNALYSHADSKKWIIMLGSEKEYPGIVTPNYESRHIFHRRLNAMVIDWASDKENVILLPLDKYIFDDSDFADSINHLAKKAYYRLAEDLISVIGPDNYEIHISGKKKLIYETLRQKARLILNGVQRRTK